MARINWTLVQHTPDHCVYVDHRNNKTKYVYDNYTYYYKGRWPNHNVRSGRKFKNG